MDMRLERNRMSAAMCLATMEDESLDMIRPFLEPIGELLDNPHVTEIMVNPNGTVFYEIDGVIEEYCPSQPISQDDLIEAGKAIARPKMDFGLNYPIVDAILPGGSRVAAMYPGCAVGGVGLTIRKFRKNWFSLDELVENGSMAREAAEIMRGVVIAGHHVLVSGGTGTGKTTFQKALIDCIPQTERLVVIEDSPELKVAHQNVLSCAAQKETRSASGTLIAPEVTIRRLLKAALRHRPDRIIIGEVRDAEAFDMIDAMNTGQSGSMSTIHANSPRQALSRLAMLCLRARLDMRYSDLLLQIGDVIEVVVQIAKEGRQRKVVAIDAVHGYNQERGRFRMKRLYGDSQNG